jgi:hypothetical protein
MRVRTIPADPALANGTSATPEAPSTNGQRDKATGRFLPGNHAASGNPHFRAMSALRMQFLRAFRPEMMNDVVGKLHALAVEGNLEATRLLLRYAIGQPLPAVDPDQADANELHLLQQCSREISLRHGTERIPADQAVAILRAMMASGLRRALADGALADVFVRQDVADALTAAGLGELVDQARVLRGRLK